MKKIKPIHPGEILLEEFLEPYKLSQYRLAKDIHVPPRRINEIVHGVRSISTDTALRLGRYFGMSPEFWLNAQMRYDLATVSDKKSLDTYKNIPVLRQPIRKRIASGIL